MAVTRVHLLIEFYTDMPSDDLEADAHADNLGDEVERAVSAIPMCVEGSVSVIDFRQLEDH